MRKQGKCKHFTGIQSKVCKAGVCYADVMPLPCLQDYRRDDAATCEHYAEPTAEEIAEDEAFIEQRMEMHRKAASAIVAIKREHKGQNWQGVVECPVCGGRLHVSHAACNGHVHGRCETADCLAWME
jgi:hypothetical protein